MRTTFHDPCQQEEFGVRGHLVVPREQVAGWAEAVEEMAALFATLSVDEDWGFYASCNDAPRAEARRVDLRLKEIVGPLVSGLLVEHRPFLASFVSKASRIGGTMGYHQDLSYVDERDARSAMAWIPLVDVDGATGALSVVPGSHRWATAVRPSGTAPLATEPLQDELAARSETIAARAGDVVFFDNAVIHGSAANTGPNVRVAVAVAFAPDEAELVIGFQEADGPLEAYAIDEAFFTTAPFRSQPRGYPSIAAWGQALRPQDLASGLRLPAVAPAGR